MSLGGTLSISWQQIQHFLIMAASSSWFKRKQTSLSSIAVTVHLEDCLLRAAVTAALGPDGIARGCKFVGLAQCVWFFFLFIIFGFEWLEVRHALLFTVSLTVSYVTHTFILSAGPLAMADETTEANRHWGWIYFVYVGKIQRKTPP